MKRNLLILLTVVAVLVIAVFALSRRERAPDSVTIVQYVEHPVISAIAAGFQEELQREATARGRTVTIDSRNANGKSDQLAAIVEHVRASHPPLTAVIGLPAAQGLKGAGVTTPVVFCGVPDAVKAGLVPTLHAHGGNFTGTQYFPPVGLIVNAVRAAWPDIHVVTVLSNPGEANSVAVAGAFVEAAKLAGLTVTQLGTSNATELEQALSKAVADGAPVFIPNDNFLYSNLTLIQSQLGAGGIPYFSVTRDSVAKGAAFSIATDYHEVGVLSARLAVKILFEGVDVRDVDVTNIESGALYVAATAPQSVRSMTLPAGYSLASVP